MKLGGIAFQANHQRPEDLVLIDDFVPQI